MMYNKALTKEDVIQRIAQLGLHNIEFLGESKIIHKQKKWLWRCKKCGRQWWECAYRVINLKRQCRTCSRKTAGQKKRYSYDTILLKLKQSGRTNITCLNQSVLHNDLYKWRWRCLHCNYEWWETPGNILNKHYGCKNCFKNHKEYYYTGDGRDFTPKRLPFTKEQLQERINTKRNDVLLVEYAGKTHLLSTWQCKKCNGIWYDTVGHIEGDKKGSKSYCPYCHISRPLQYIVDNDSFDSRWEIIYYLYHKMNTHKIYRLHREIGLPYVYNDKSCTWFPDFFLYPHNDLLQQYPLIFEKHGELIEIKPENGGYDPEKTQAKKESGWDVAFVGWDKIKPMWDWLLTRNVDIDKYLVKK